MSETGDKQPFAVNVELSDRRSAVEPRKGYFAALNNFFQSSVGAAALTLISTTLLGGFIGYVFTDMERQRADHTAQMDKAHADAADQAKSDSANRAALVGAAAKLIGARRVDADILRTAILHHASLSEVNARWSDYQKAYADYTLGVFAFRSAALSYLGAGTTNAFAPVLESSISNSFMRVDTCLTESYFWYANKSIAKAEDALNNCRTQAGNVRPQDIATEMTLEDTCVASFEKELAYSIYIENNFENLLDKTPPKDGLRYSPRKFKSCMTKSDWLCLQQISPVVISQRLKKSCGALDGIAKPAPDAPRSDIKQPL
jgi:hypothetical protein